jgi:competence protein ComEC
MLDLRLAAPVVAAWVTVGVLIAAPGLLAGSAIALWGAALAGCCIAVLSRGGVRMIALGLILTLAATALLVSVAAVRAPARQPGVLVNAAGAGRFVTATAVTNQAVRRGGTGDAARRPPFAATLRSVRVGARSVEVDIPITVFAGSIGATAGIGATLELVGTLAAADPGDEVAFRFFTSRAPTTVSSPPRYLEWANGLREGFRAAANELPGDGGDLLPGLAIGDTSAVRAPLDSAMKATSLSHLTAVSGANCAVVIALMMLVGAALGIPRGWRIAASVTTLAGFVVLVTPQPSVLRAAVMATLVLASMAGGRPARGVPTLALASLLLLVNDPWLSRSYGFVLSVLATGGLLLLAGPLARVFSRRLPLGLAGMLAVPLAAQLACQPVLILLNPSIPTFGVVANLLAEPAAPVATVLGLVSCVVLPVLPAVGRFVAWLAWLPSTWIASVAAFFAGLPGAAIPWAPGALGVVAAAVVIALALVVLFLRRGRTTHTVASVALALLLAGSVGVLAGDGIRLRVSRPGDWQIAVCDIGQGDAVLVRSLGQVALVDTGREPKLLRACLDSLGIGHVDLLVLTHWDMDHVGGTSAVFGRVTRAMIGPTDGSPASSIGGQLADSGAAVSQASQGLTGRLGELGWEVLWPKARLGTVRPGNDASVTLRFSGVGACRAGCLSAMFLGDLGDRPQALMMAANRIGPVDVVKVAHHGSADQNARLYAALHATVGVIGVGLDNRYGHPTAALLRILASDGTLATRTDLEGMTLLSPGEDGSVRIWSERPLPAGKLLAH